MNAEFIEALNVIEKERGVSKEKLIEALEAALISAYRRNYGNVGNARAEVDIETGEAKIYASKAVVEKVEDPLTEVSLENAKRINALYEVGDVIEEEVRPKNFGRIAAQTAKQVVVQRIRETERSNAYDEYMEKEPRCVRASFSGWIKQGSISPSGVQADSWTPGRFRLERPMKPICGSRYTFWK